MIIENYWNFLESIEDYRYLLQINEFYWKLLESMGKAGELLEFIGIY